MGILSRLFGSNTSTHSDQFWENPVQVDLHSHYLPGIDDGVKTAHESVAILRRLEENGFRKAVTTPHVMGDYYRNTPEIINEKLYGVRDHMKQEGLTIELEAAAEYYCDEWLPEKIQQDQILSFGKDKYVLIETAFMNQPGNLLQIIFDLRIAGYKPVLAHPERYQYLRPGTELWEQIMNSGVLLQLNILSVTGYYSPAVARAARYLIENELIHFVGGDVHNERHLDQVLETVKTNKWYRKACELPLLNNSL